MKWRDILLFIPYIFLYKIFLVWLLPYVIDLCFPLVFFFMHSMAVVQMLLQLLSTPTISLMWTLIVLKRLWTGRCFLFLSSFGCGFCISSFIVSNLWCFHMVYQSDLHSSLSNHWCQLMLPLEKLKLLILVRFSFVI